MATGLPQPLVKLAPFRIVLSKIVRNVLKFVNYITYLNTTDGFGQYSVTLCVRDTIACKGSLCCHYLYFYVFEILMIVKIINVVSLSINCQKSLLMTSTHLDILAMKGVEKTTFQWHNLWEHTAIKLSQIFIQTLEQRNGKEFDGENFRQN